MSFFVEFVLFEVGEGRHLGNDCQVPAERQTSAERRCTASPFYLSWNLSIGMTSRCCFRFLVSTSCDPEVNDKYVAGFKECTSEVTSYLDSIDGLTSEARSQVVRHLSNHLHCNNNRASGSDGMQQFTVM